eukprot:2182220-Prymnesium_polylepis.1
MQPHAAATAISPLAAPHVTGAHRASTFKNRETQPRPDPCTGRGRPSNAPLASRACRQSSPARTRDGATVKGA